MLKRIGTKNIGNAGKDVKIASFIRDWGEIQERALENGDVRELSQVGAKKLVGFMNDMGIHYTTITSGMVFTLDYIKTLQHKPCDAGMAMTLTFTEMTVFLRDQGHTGNRFKSKSDAVSYVVDELNRQELPVNVIDSGEDETSDGASSEVASPCSSECLSITDYVSYLSQVEEDEETSETKGIRVNVSTPKGDLQICSLVITDIGITIADLKELIVAKVAQKNFHEMKTLNADMFRLFCDGPMHSESLLSDFLREDETSLHVCLELTLKGGASGAKKTVMKSEKMTKVRSGYIASQKACSQSPSAPFLQRAMERANLVVSNPSETLVKDYIANCSREELNHLKELWYNGSTHPERFRDEIAPLFLPLLVEIQESDDINKKAKDVLTTAFHTKFLAEFMSENGRYSLSSFEKAIYMRGKEFEKEDQIESEVARRVSERLSQHSSDQNMGH